MAAAVGLETSVPGDELKRVVTRLLARCVRTPSGCLVHPTVKHTTPQVRARLGKGRFLVLSAPRAVLAAHGRPCPPAQDVQRACDNRGCLEPSHLKAMPPGTLVGAAKERVHEAKIIAARARRKWTERDIAKLRRAVARTNSVVHAADRLGIPRGTANHMLSGSLWDRSMLGSRDQERCSRCHELGHRRTSPDCPGREGVE